VNTITGGIVVATFFVGAGGVDIDLAPYFGYNKDYLSYPLTAVTGDTLYLFAQEQGIFTLVQLWLVMPITETLLIGHLRDDYGYFWRHIPAESAIQAYAFPPPLSFTLFGG
jgi:hypothetical protein